MQYQNTIWKPTIPFLCSFKSKLHNIWLPNPNMDPMPSSVEYPSQVPNVLYIFRLHICGCIHLHISRMINVTKNTDIWPLYKSDCREIINNYWLDIKVSRLCQKTSASYFCYTKSKYTGVAWLFFLRSEIEKNIRSLLVLIWGSEPCIGRRDKELVLASHYNVQHLARRLERVF